MKWNKLAQIPISLLILSMLLLGNHPASAAPSNSSLTEDKVVEVAIHEQENSLHATPLPVPSVLVVPEAKNANPASRDSNALLQSLGLPKSQWKQLSENTSLLDKLFLTSSDAKTVYKSLSFFEKVKLQKQVHGKTDVVLFTVDNLSAFISGKVGAQDVFVVLKANLDKKLHDGKITAEEYQRRNSGIEAISKLAPEDRSTMVALLDEELKVRGLENPEDKQASAK